MTDEPTASGTAATDAPPVVLIVDDSRVMRVSLARLLGKTCRVIETENGQQGWETLQSNPEIDLVFADLSMPVMDGFELLRRVRSAEDPGLSGLPFVVITGAEDEEGMQRKALELGASDFVSKPFRSHEITARAKSLTEKRREVRELRQELDERAADDAVTGLAHASRFATHFDKLLSLTQRHGLASACLLVQLDGFDRWAAEAGEPASGELLRRLADLLGELVRVEDATGYLGHGRFALALTGADRAGALALAQRLGSRLASLSAGAHPLPDLQVGISTPDLRQAATVDVLLQSAEADLATLPRVPAAAEAAADTAPLAASGLGELQQELEQTRESLQLAEQAEQSRSEQLRSLQESSRQQLAKAHQVISTLRTQLSSLQTKFRDYAQRFSPAAQQQAEEQVARLRATLEERDQQLQAEEQLRRDAQAMVTQLQARLAEAQQAAEADAAKPRGLASRLFRRD